MIIAWFSCGVTSAVACKIALSLYENVQLYSRRYSMKLHRLNVMLEQHA